MAKIESISVASARVPFENVTSFATRTVSARDYGLVKLRAGGVEGIGFCYAGSSGGTLVAQAVEQLLARACSAAKACSSKAFGNACSRKHCCTDAPAASCARSRSWTVRFGT